MNDYTLTLPDGEEIEVHRLNDLFDAEAFNVDDELKWEEADIAGLPEDYKLLVWWEAYGDLDFMNTMFALDNWGTAYVIYDCVCESKPWAGTLDELIIETFT